MAPSLNTLTSAFEDAVLARFGKLDRRVLDALSACLTVAYQGPESASLSSLATFRGSQAEPDPESLSAHLAAERLIGSEDYSEDTYVAAVELVDRLGQVTPEGFREPVTIVPDDVAAETAAANVALDRVGGSLRGTDESRYLDELLRAEREARGMTLDDQDA